MSTITGALTNEKGLTSPASIQRFTRVAIWGLPLWATMLFFSTLTHQPDPQTDFASFASYVTTTKFLLSHLINSIAGAAIGSIGVIALMLYLLNTSASGKAMIGMVAAVTGNTLTSAVFGAAAFAQTAIGHAYLSGEQNALVFYNLVYSAPLFGTVMIGLLLFITGGIFAGMAITKSGCFPSWAGWLYGISISGFVLSNIFFSSIQSIILFMLFLSTTVVAWTVGRK